VNLVLTLRRPAEADGNPWGATTLEWAPGAMETHPTDEAPVVYRGPCCYNESGDKFLTQWSGETTFHTEPE